jgi:hypothetical protein
LAVVGEEVDAFGGGEGAAVGAAGEIDERVEMAGFGVGAGFFDGADGGVGGWRDG